MSDRPVFWARATPTGRSKKAGGWDEQQTEQSWCWLGQWGGRQRLRDVGSDGSGSELGHMEIGGDLENGTLSGKKINEKNGLLPEF